MHVLYITIYIITFNSFISQPQVINPNGSSLSHGNEDVTLDSVGEPPPSPSISSIDSSSGPFTFIGQFNFYFYLFDIILTNFLQKLLEGNFDQLPHHEDISQASPLTLGNNNTLSIMLI